MLVAALTQPKGAYNANNQLNRPNLKCSFSSCRFIVLLLIVDAARSPWSIEIGVHKWIK
jgi:hypothetical protein